MIAVSSTLDHYRDREMTLEELVRAAARWLHRLALRPEDGRVADAVDARGVRYYQTLGVIDRPVRYDGRRAVYFYRHLLQLLCVKKLQQEGHPLQLIQRALAGRSTEALERALLQSEGEESGQRYDEGEKPASNGHRQTAAPALVAAQVAPGVTVTVDATQIEHAEQVIEEIRRFLSPLITEERHV